MITCFGPGSGRNSGSVFPDLAAPLLGTGLVRGAVSKLFPESGLRV
jgi:hypothetical protein